MGTADLARWIDMGLTGLFVLTGAIMTFFILLQEGKGGGLTALGGTKAAGVEGVTNPIRRATVYMAILFFTLAIILGVIHRPRPSTVIGSGPATTPPTEAVTPSLAPKTISADDVKAVVPQAKKPEESAKPAEAKTVETKTIEVKAPEAKKDEMKTEAVKTPEPAAKKAEPPAEPPKAEAKKEESANTEPKKDQAPEKAAEPKN